MDRIYSLCMAADRSKRMVSMIKSWRPRKQMEKMYLKIGGGHAKSYGTETAGRL